MHPINRHKTNITNLQGIDIDHNGQRILDDEGSQQGNVHDYHDGQACGRCPGHLAVGLFGVEIGFQVVAGLEGNFLGG